MPNPQTTGRGPKGNKYYQNSKQLGQKDQSEKRKLSMSKYFRNFYRTKVKAFMTSYDDTHYLVINNLYMANVTAGNPEAAINNILDVAWEISAKTGNIKDLDATQEANFKTWVVNWLLICFEVAAQNMIRPHMAAYTESSTTATTNTAYAPYVQADWDALISSLEGLECPAFAKEFVKLFCWNIKMSEGYEKAGLEIPPSYFIPIINMKVLSNIQGYRETAKGVMGNAMIHCKKFGIPFSKFSLSDFNPREVTRAQAFMDADIVAFLSYCKIKYYDNAPAIETLTHQMDAATNNDIHSGTDKTVDYTDAKYIFPGNMSMLHALAPLFGSYNATNNIWGGILLTLDVDTNEYEVSLRKMKILGTSFTALTMNGGVDNHIMKLFAVMYTSSATARFEWSGSAITASSSFDIHDWIAFDLNPELLEGNASVKYEEAKDSLENVGSLLCYGEK